MEHVRFIMLRISVLILLLGAFSCDDLSREPRAKPDTLHFDAQGGEKIVEITNLKTQWYYSGLHAKTTVDNDPEAYNLEDVNPEEITLETLSDGMQQVHYDWVTFQYPKSKKYVKVIVAPNKSEKIRIVRFYSMGSKTSLSSFLVTQLGVKAH